MFENVINWTKMSWNFGLFISVTVLMVRSPFCQGMAVHGHQVCSTLEQTDKKFIRVSKGLTLGRLKNAMLLVKIIHFPPNIECWSVSIPDLTCR